MPCKAQPSKVCTDELKDEINSQSYQDYFNLYNQQNCKPLDPYPYSTYTRMAGKDETKLPKLKDTSYSDRITDHYTENSYSFEDKTEYDCLCCKERTAHYQLEDIGSGASTPDGIPYQCSEEKILIPMVMLVLRKGGTSLQMQAYELSPISKETFIEAVKSQMQIARMPSNPNP